MPSSPPPTDQVFSAWYFTSMALFYRFSRDTRWRKVSQTLLVRGGHSTFLFPFFWFSKTCVFFDFRAAPCWTPLPPALLFEGDELPPVFRVLCACPARSSRRKDIFFFMFPLIAGVTSPRAKDKRLFPFCSLPTPRHRLIFPREVSTEKIDAP